MTGFDNYLLKYVHDGDRGREYCERQLIQKEDPSSSNNVKQVRQPISSRRIEGRQKRTSAGSRQIPNNSMGFDRFVPLPQPSVLPLYALRRTLDWTAAFPASPVIWLFFVLPSLSERPISGTYICQKSRHSISTVNTQPQLWRCGGSLCQCLIDKAAPPLILSP